MAEKARNFVAEQSPERYPQRRGSFQESLRSYGEKSPERPSPIKAKKIEEEKTTEKKKKKPKPMSPAVEKIAKKVEKAPKSPPNNKKATVPENKNPKKTAPLAPPDAKLGKKAEQTPKAEDINRLTPESLPKLDLKDTNSSGKRRPRV